MKAHSAVISFSKLILCLYFKFLMVLSVSSSKQNEQKKIFLAVAQFCTVKELCENNNLDLHDSCLTNEFLS